MCPKHIYNVILTIGWGTRGKLPASLICQEVKGPKGEFEHWSITFLVLNVPFQRVLLMLMFNSNHFD